MKYACLIYADESDKSISPDPGDPGFEEMMGGYMAFSAAIEEAGVWVGGEPLELTSTATSTSRPVCVASGRPIGAASHASKRPAGDSSTCSMTPT